MVLVDDHCAAEASPLRKNPTEAVIKVAAVWFIPGGEYPVR